MRTATTAIDRSNTGGICQARVINQADSPASARALPSDNTPSATAEQQAGDPRVQQPHRGRQGIRPEHDGVPRAGHLDDLITDSDDLFAVADDHHGGTGARRSTMARSTRASVAASRCAVGSSSSSTGAGEPSARAKPRR